ncbi:forkhead box protein N3-like isoform X2 [Coccinella septempunctata]|uniref:forkhead box protein N3-like isoform X2 n=1 Tax=Coccinella septempunctata TaxID=41139 RepID=UPI001D086C3C|nr:forkhead box protein N3-like isoform X2 [Coccinella septempunctata]
MMVTNQNFCVYYQQDVIGNSQQSDTVETDWGDSNLSWLLNYKIHELPPIPETTHIIEENNLLDAFPETLTFEFTDLDGNDFDLGNTEIIFAEESEIIPQETLKPSGPTKPPYTYTELIEHALTDKGELTVSGIYHWISEHFPFYKEGDDRWKNSVRHNLSINPHFRKGSKAPHGAGHLWTIAEKVRRKSMQILFLPPMTDGR